MFLSIEQLIASPPRAEDEFGLGLVAELVAPKAIKAIQAPKMRREARKAAAELREFQAAQERERYERERREREVARLQELVEQHRTAGIRELEAIQGGMQRVDLLVETWLQESQGVLTRLEQIQVEIAALYEKAEQVLAEAVGGASASYEDPAGLAAAESLLSGIKAAIGSKRMEAIRLADKAAALAQAGRSIQPPNYAPGGAALALPNARNPSSMLALPPGAPPPFLPGAPPPFLPGAPLPFLPGAPLPLAGLGVSPFQSLFDRLFRKDKAEARDTKGAFVATQEAALEQERAAVSGGLFGSLLKIAGVTAAGLGAVWLGAKLLKRRGRR